MRSGDTLSMGKKAIDSYGYNSIRVEGFRSCFDIIAERNGSMLIFKFISNIDGATKENSDALRKIGAMFNADTFVVGRTYKSSTIRSGFIFQRHGVNCISEDTFEDVLKSKTVKRAQKFIIEKSMPNGELIKSLRKLSGMSREDLAKEVGLSKDSIYRYESGKSWISKKNLKKLEDYFGRSLKFETEEYANFSEPVGTSSKGMKFTYIRKDPFRMIGKGRKRYEIGRLANQRTMKKWSEFYRKLNEEFDDYPFYLTRRKIYSKSINGVPVIGKSVFDSLPDEDALLELITYR